MPRIMFIIKTIVLNLGVATVVAAQNPRAIPVEYGNNIPVNYVRTWTSVKPVVNPNDLVIGNGLQVSKISTTHLDGLGREIQTVDKQGSLETGASPVDMVAMIEYDEYGREQFKYLSAPASNIGGNTNVNNGQFKRNAFAQQEAFYNNYLGGQTDEVKSGKNWAYQQTRYELSPLNRVTEKYEPGVNWVGTNGKINESDRRALKAKYWLNTGEDDVRIWTTNQGALGNLSDYISPGEYGEGVLYKMVKIDEHNKQVIEFTNKEGKMVLKKVQLTASSDDGNGSGHAGWLCTYYIYDEFDNLRCVLLPEGVMAISGSWLLNDATILAEQCFRYEYDNRNNIIVRKNPGSKPVYFVYDARGRLVMKQDENLRLLSPQQWEVMVYDNLNRLVTTGLLKNAYSVGGVSNRSFTQHLEAASSAINYPFSLSSPPSETYWEMITENGFDNYSNLPGGLPVGLDAVYNSSWNSEFHPTDNVNFPYPKMPAQDINVKGLMTWMRVKVLNSSPSQFLTTILIYDDDGNLIQVKSNNITGGVDIKTSQFSWNGLQLVNIEKHQNSVGTGQETVMITKMEYDDLERVIQIYMKLQNSLVNGGVMSAFKSIYRAEYNALGQLKSKVLAPEYNSGAGLEALNYEYNIRGWLLGTNRDFTRDDNTDHYFGFDLGYDKLDNNLAGNGTYNAGQFNGNVSGMVWRSKGDNKIRRYDFNYDATNRLMKAEFTQFTEGSFNQSAGVNFNLRIGDGIDVSTAYDANGNIKKMQRWGVRVGGSPQIDNLTYTYYTNSNQLREVSDAVSADYKLGDFQDRQPMSRTDYTYDDNGSLTMDYNKSISSVSYNFLKLADEIVVDDKGVMMFIYDGEGKKLKKIVVEEDVSVEHNGNLYTSDITTTTTYIGVFTYQERTYMNGSVSSLNRPDALQHISIGEGRVRLKEADMTFQFDYFIRDHLENVRIVLTEEQQSDEYPAATMESGDIDDEEVFYSNLNSTKVNKPSWFYDGNFTTNATVAVLKNATNFEKIGPSIVLKVMAGDSYNIRVASGWSSSISSTNSNVAVLQQLFQMLTDGVALASGGKVLAAELRHGSSGISSNLGTFLSQQSSPSKVNAYVNWVLLDEKFNIAKDPNGNIIASGYSGYDPVGIVSGGTKIHTLPGLTVAESGYLYIYTSNESTNVDVYFDNLQVTHIRGPILEETHYYPFGLKMAGISSTALAFGDPVNNNKYNSIELNSELDLGIYDAFYRDLDPQTGRFWQIDPKLEYMPSLSPYVAMGNNPIINFDPFGDIVRNAHDEEVQLAQTELDDAERILNLLMQQHNLADRGIRKKAFRASGRSRAEWRAFRKARKQVRKKESKLRGALRNQFEATEDINELRHNNPTLFNAVDALPIDVFLGRTNDSKITSDAGGGANLWALNAAGAVRGRLMNLDPYFDKERQFRNGMAIWIQNGRGNYTTILHEVGHTVSMYGGVAALNIQGIPFGAARMPVDMMDYYRNFAADWGGGCEDCRTARRCNPTSAAAVEAQGLAREAAQPYVRRVNPN